MADFEVETGQYMGPSLHPYLHDALLYISNLPDVVSDEHLAAVFTQIGPFRPKINRDAPGPAKNGTIEFKTQDLG
jgi:polyadenylate-binding protein